MSITQEMRYRLSVVKCAKRYGARRAVAKCRTSPASIYRWIKIYEGNGGDISSLASKSRRPHYHPNSHTEAEIKLIKDTRRRNSNLGLQDLWLRLKARDCLRYLPLHAGPPAKVVLRCVGSAFGFKSGDLQSGAC